MTASACALSPVPLTAFFCNKTTICSSLGVGTGNWPKTHQNADKFCFKCLLRNIVMLICLMKHRTLLQCTTGFMVFNSLITFYRPTITTLLSPKPIILFTLSIVAISSHHPILTKLIYIYLLSEFSCMTYCSQVWQPDLLMDIKLL